MNIENFRKNLVEKFVKGFNDDFKAENAFHLLRVKNIEKEIVPNSGLFLKQTQENEKILFNYIQDYISGFITGFKATGLEMPSFLQEIDEVDFCDDFVADVINYCKNG